MNAKLVLDRFLPYRLSVASNAVSTRIAGAYRKRFGLKIAEWRLVAILAEDTPLTPATLAERTRMDKIAVSRAATVLIERGLVERADNPEDGRSHLLSLTGAGQRLYDQVAPLALDTEAQLFAGLTADERRVLEALLRRIEQAAQSKS